ncbi:MAG TPA: Spy/CpxP family protein refolding chaperone [Albitalea sp.]
MTRTNGTGEAAARRGLRWLAAGMVLAISASVALSAWAHQGGPGGRHGGMAMDGPAMFMGKAGGRGLERMLEGVNATDAQRAQIRQITQQAAEDMKAEREQHRALRQRMLEAFTAPTVDAATVESLRQQMLAQHDTRSRRMLQAMLDVSRVLTPEQRAQIGERMKQRMQRMQERMQQHQQPQRTQ